MSDKSVSSDNIQKESDHPKQENIEIKSNMNNPDSLLTEEDEISLQNYRKEKENGQLLSESEVKAGLNL